MSQSVFATKEEIKKTLETDIAQAIESPLNVELIPPNTFPQFKEFQIQETCLDHLQITIDQYRLEPAFLITEDQLVYETVYSHLFRSNCPVTNQPDWASVVIRYA